MCYALSKGFLGRSDVLELGDFAGTKQTAPDPDMAHEHSSIDNLRKRSASESIEKDSAKKMKMSSTVETDGENDTHSVSGSVDQRAPMVDGGAAGDDEASSSTSELSAAPSTDGRSQGNAIQEETEMDRLINELEGLREEVKSQKGELTCLRDELKESKDDCEYWRLQACTLTAKEETRNSNAKQLEVERNAEMKLTSRKIEESFKKKLEQKLTVQSEKADDKYQDLRARFNKKISETNARHKKENESIREKMEELMEDRKEEKAETAELRKRLRDEQQAEIRKHKPETAVALKVKILALEEKQSEIRMLQDQIQKLTEKADKFEDAVDKLEEERKTLIHAMEQSSTALASVNLDLEATKAINERLVRTREQEVQEYERRLDTESEKWQKQNDVASNYAKEANNHRRAVFNLRNVNDRKDKEVAVVKATVIEMSKCNERKDEQIAALEAEVHDLTAAVESIKAEAWRANVDETASTEKTALTESGTIAESVVDGEAGADVAG